MSSTTLSAPAPKPACSPTRRCVRMAAPLAVGVAAAGRCGSWSARCFDVPAYLVPAPSVIAKTLAEDWPVLSSALLTTLKVTFLAFALAVVLGVAAAFLFVQSRLMEISLFPYAIVLQVTPIVAIAPLIIIWVATDAGDGDLRDAGGAVPDHLQHHPRAAQRQPGAC